MPTLVCKSSFMHLLLYVLTILALTACSLHFLVSSLQLAMNITDGVTALQDLVEMTAQSQVRQETLRLYCNSNL